MFKFLLLLPAVLPVVYYAKFPCPFLTAKAVLFQIFIILMTPVWFWRVYKKESHLPTNASIILKLWGVLLVWMFFCNIRAEFPDFAFYSSILRMDGYIPLLCYFIYALMLCSTFKLKDFSYWAILSLLISIPVTIKAIMQALGRAPIYRALEAREAYHPDAYFGNSLHLGQFCLFQVFIALAFIAFLWGDPRGRDYRKFSFPLLGVLILNFIGIYLCKSRAAWLGTTIGLCIIVVPIFHKKLVAILFFLIVAISFYKLTPRFSYADFHGDPRVKLWRWGFAGIRTKPLMGYGQENFVMVKIKGKDPSDPTHKRYLVDRIGVDKLHSLAIDWAVWGGIPALMIVFLIFFSIAQELYLHDSKIIFAGFIAYTVQDLVFFDNINTYIVLFVCIAYCQVLWQNYSDTHITMVDRANIYIKGRIYERSWRC